ncbi:HlyD family secretion protein [Desulforhopalus sp. IMCC35007]|uniref:HlyD family secretion protein n=1 Tax=Desulforhopalus sp. IMCC35007 TaxID=2569543 RepID=UPI001F0EA4B3|nr:HlyD family efflux transporter periplasmic adaptor subunit [Desulforhopalus sp. IMCC35007]
MANSRSKKWWIALLVLASISIVGAYVWLNHQGLEISDDIASGNGRIEATEIDIATKNPGRIAEILVGEGDYLQKNQITARMDTKALEAQLRQAKASVVQARHGKSYAEALVQQRTSELAVSQKDYERSQATYEANQHAISIRQLDHDRATMQATAALLAEAEAKVLEAEAVIEVALASTQQIEEVIDESILKTPISGRVLYRLAEEGEVLGAGGKVLTVLDLTDVFMTIFLPTAQASRVQIGAEARFVFDALADITVPAKVTFVSPNAQFTPKAVETRTEREKLMFRIKVKIDPALLLGHLEQVKTGVPGVAYIRLDPTADWPEDVQRRSLP